MQMIKFDVGANMGKDTQRLAADGSIVYAFEPTQELLHQFLWPIQKQNPNVIVVPFAVDVENGFKTFNISANRDWGCSSLYDFADDIHQKWPNRPDFVKTHSYKVPTITLYDFVNMYNIPSIDYLHIDAQGSDFKVLLSLKDKISIVKSGVVEAWNKVELYKGTSNSAVEIRNFLLSNGFTITREETNDVVGAEINIYFIRK
jgi:FkbM family methyltransferase